MQDSENPFTKNRDILIWSREMPERILPLITKDDVLFILEYPIVWLLTRIAHERQWLRLTRLMRSVERGLWLGGRISSNDKRIAKTSQRLGLEWNSREIAKDVDATRLEHRFQVFKTQSRTGWNPDITLLGEEAIQQAAPGRKGALIWIAHFSFNPLVGKIALNRVGYTVSHVSRPEHGFSKSRFGIKWLNSIRCAAEAKWVRQRIVIDRKDPDGLRKKIQQALHAGEFVSITAGNWEGRAMVTGNLLGAKHTVSIGAPALAHSHSVPLLACFVTRSRDGSSFVVDMSHVATPHPQEEKSEFVGRASANYFDMLEQAVLRSPEQWRGWSSLKYE